MGAPSPHHWTLPALSCDGAFVSIYPRSPRKQALHSEIRGQGSLDITALEQRGELTDHKWKPEVRGSRGPGCSGWGSPRGQFEGGGLAPQAWPRWLSRGHWHPRGGGGGKADAPARGRAVPGGWGPWGRSAAVRAPGPLSLEPGLSAHLCLRTSRRLPVVHVPLFPPRARLSLLPLPSPPPCHIRAAALPCPPHPPGLSAAPGPRLRAGHRSWMMRRKGEMHLRKGSLRQH